MQQAFISLLAFISLVQSIPVFVLQAFASLVVQALVALLLLAIVHDFVAFVPLTEAQALS